MEITHPKTHSVYGFLCFWSPLNLVKISASWSISCTIYLPQLWYCRYSEHLCFSCILLLLVNWKPICHCSQNSFDSEFKQENSYRFQTISFTMKSKSLLLWRVVVLNIPEAVLRRMLWTLKSKNCKIVYFQKLIITESNLVKSKRPKLTAMLEQYRTLWVLFMWCC